MNLIKDNKKILRITINALLIIIFGLICCSMKQWLIPFIISLILAYAFHSPTNAISNKLKISSTISAGIVVTFIITVISFFILFLVPLVKNAVIMLIRKIPILMQPLPNIINNTLNNLSKSLGIDNTFDIGNIINRYLMDLTIDFPGYLLNFINTGTTIIYIITFSFMIPIITFYLLKDWDKLENSFNKLLLKFASEDVIQISKRINTKLSQYMRGQLIVCSILSLLYVIGLSCIGIHKFVICGVFSGILSFAPFFGPLIGLITTLALSIDNFQYSYQYNLIICLYIIVPFTDSNFITPKLIGKSTGIQPVWLLFSICATVSILGTAGIFISVPTAVVLSTICKEIMNRV